MLGADSVEIILLLVLVSPPEARGLGEAGWVE